jgi:hypothetical protein
VNTQRPLFRWLVAGDLLTVLVVTITGFVTHYGAISGWRWLSTFFPVLAAWLALAPWLGVYDPARYLRPAHAWRAALAALLSAPLAALLRALWLGGVITPVFVLVLAATDALGFLIWRLAWAWLAGRAPAAQMAGPKGAENG